MITRGELLGFLRQHKLAVEATLHARGMPQAAVIGVAVTDDLALVFDTLSTSRKCQNLRRHPMIALAIGWDTATVQLEGVADEPHGAERERLVQVYLDAFPDGVVRQHLEHITYVRVRPCWLRYSDFAIEPPRIFELDAAGLAALT